MIWRIFLNFYMLNYTKMKKQLIRLCLLATIFAMAVGSAEAQAKRTTKKRTVVAKKKTTNKNQGGANAAVAVAPKDTVKPAPVVEADIKLDTPRKSLRNDAIIERNLVKDRTPLAYEHIREDDAVYRQRIWREIDVHEKMNLPFVYKATEDNGNQRFINILLNGIKSGMITAFDANIDDRFTTPMTFKDIAVSMVGKPITIQIGDAKNDPDGSKGLQKDTTIMQEFNPDAIERYLIKEEWVFDKESSRMTVRNLGICPEKTILNPDGSFRFALPVCWVYYPDLRPMLAKFEAYNGKNFGGRMSWEELFESRIFSGRIVKSTVDNPGDNYVEMFIKDPILRLLEGEKIKEKMFNYE